MTYVKNNFYFYFIYYKYYINSWFRRKIVFWFTHIFSEVKLLIQLCWKFLFKEGTLVAKKDVHAEKHSEALPIPNLEVLCLLRSFRSKGYCKETFNWQYYYYYLTNEGIEYLREYLALPDEIVPATLKKVATATPTGVKDNNSKAKSAGPGGDFNPEFQKDRGNKDGYRR
jgi:small subunit ribosomal protein S10e